MNDTDKVAKIIGDDLMKELDDGEWKTLDVQMDVVKKLTDDQLKEISSDLTEEDQEKWYELMKKEVSIKIRARRELSYRAIYKRAEKVMNAEGSSGIFCVYHDCDMKDCTEKHQDE